ncbi:uncharacterized protein LOC135817294 isoform X1 [Sycon ciliatum]|uniref:uncharacterized protein LOC135817294 isoform X1 n=1 Tax=Sycon ciliatum TaxID=27933 RepID=UPI0031F66ED9
MAIESMSSTSAAHGVLSDSGSARSKVSSGAGSGNRVLAERKHPALSSSRSVGRATATAAASSSNSSSSAASPAQKPISIRRSHSSVTCTSVTATHWQTIAEDSDCNPPPLPPRPQPATPTSSLSLKLCVKRSGQRLKRAISVCKSLPPAPPVSSPVIHSVAARSLRSRRNSLPSAVLHSAAADPASASGLSRKHSDAALSTRQTHPFGRRALPREPGAEAPASTAVCQLENTRPAAAAVEPVRIPAAQIRSNRVRRHTVNRSSPRPISQSSTSESDSASSPRIIMSAPPIAPRPAHTLTEKSSSGSSGYSSRGQSPAHRQSSAPIIDLTPDTPQRRRFKESISLPIGQSSSSDQVCESPTATSVPRSGRRGSQDSGILPAAADQSPTGGASAHGPKGVKAGLRRMVGSLKRGGTTPKKKLPADACLSPPTPDMTVNCGWPTLSPAQLQASDEALLRAHRSHLPLQRCSASGSSVHSMMHQHQHDRAAAALGASGRRDLQLIGRAHSLPAHPVHAPAHHHSQANRQLSSGQLEHTNTVLARKGSDYNSRYRPFDWFFGRMSRERAHRLLSEHGAVGNFLLRERDTCPGEYAISVKVPQTVLHFRVYNDEHGYVCNKDAGPCPTLIDLVRYHTTIPLTGNGSGSDDVFYLGHPLNRALIPVSEGLPSVTSSSSSLVGSSAISRQNSSELQDINEELYLEPLQCSATPSDSEVSKADETEEDAEGEDDDTTVTQQMNGIYIDENKDIITESESSA